MANQVTTTFRIDAQGAINSLSQYNTQLQKTVQLQKQLGGSATAVGSGGGTGGGGGQAGGLGGVGRGVLGAVSFAAVAAFTKQAVDASNEATRANRALAASAVEAGRSYNDLAKSSAEFARAAGISNAQAARSTAQLQRLTTLAGEGDQLEKYQKGFLDLAAARGVAFEELDTLFSGIIAGTDDALNRFGKADPSKLAAQYAAQLGKSVDQLTEQEKILSRLKAFDPDFGLFAGANEARLQSFDGRLDQFNATLENTIALFGDWIANSSIVSDNLEFISLVLKQFSGPSSSQIRELVASGRSQGEIVQALEPSTTEVLYNRLRAGFSKGSPIGLITRLFTGRFYDAEEGTKLREVETGRKVAAQTALDELEEAAARSQRQANARTESENARRALYQQRLQELTRFYAFERELSQANLTVYEAQRRSMLDGTMAAEMRYNQEISAARINTLKNESLLQNKNFADLINFNRMIGNEGEVQKVQGEQRTFNLKQAVAIRLEEISAIQKQAELEKKRAETIKRINLDLRNQAIGFVGEQNPYVRIFSDAQTAAEELIEKTKEFGFEFKRSILQGLQQRANIALFQQDITNLRGAVALRREARELDYGYDPSQFSQEEAEAYRRRSISEDLEAIEAAFRRTDRSAQAQRLRDQAIIDATRGANYRELFYEDRAEAVAAREREATRLEQDRSSARAAFDRLLNEFDNGGVRVRIAEGQTLIRIIDESNGRAEIATRPSNASTGARYR
jgi:hypothetical protein